MPPQETHNRNRLQAVEIVLPATSANLGPAFDAAALALSIFLKVRAKPADKFSIRAAGRDADICAQIENHLILTTYREVLHAEKKGPIPLALHIKNDIPIGKGCGSSAAARLAGIYLAAHFGKLGWNGSRIVAEAARREHHPDNVAACWMGALAIARMSDCGGISIARIVPKGKWPLLLVVPNESLPTEKARNILPQSYPRSNVIRNLQNSMLLLAAFVQGKPELLASSLGDTLHQPYRAKLCPLLPALQDLSGDSGILGAALSGAGPSVLLFLDSRANLARVRAQVRDRIRNRGLKTELIPTEITIRGSSERIR